MVRIKTVALVWADFFTSLSYHGSSVGSHFRHVDGMELRLKWARLVKMKSDFPLILLPGTPPHQSTPCATWFPVFPCSVVVFTFLVFFFLQIQYCLLFVFWSLVVLLVWGFSQCVSFPNKPFCLGTTSGLSPFFPCLRHDSHVVGVGMHFTNASSPTFYLEKSCW